MQFTERLRNAVENQVDNVDACNLILKSWQLRMLMKIVKRYYVL